MSYSSLCEETRDAAWESSYNRWCDDTKVDHDLREKRERWLRATADHAQAASADHQALTNCIVRIESERHDDIGYYAVDVLRQADIRHRQTERLLDSAHEVVANNSALMQKIDLLESDRTKLARQNDDLTKELDATRERLRDTEKQLEYARRKHKSSPADNAYNAKYYRMEAEITQLRAENRQLKAEKEYRWLNLSPGNSAASQAKRR